MARDEARKATQKEEALATFASADRQEGVKMPPPPPDVREVMAEHIAELVERITDLTERVTALENR